MTLEPNFRSPRTHSISVDRCITIRHMTFRQLTIRHLTIRQLTSRNLTIRQLTIRQLQNHKLSSPTPLLAVLSILPTRR